MKFLALAALFATALAAPNLPAHGSGSDYTNKQDIDQKQSITPQQCGKANLRCCSAEDKSSKVDPEAGNELLRLLGDDGLGGLLQNYSGCEPLANVEALAITDVVKNGKCNNHVACCNQAGDGNEHNQQGLVNAAIPCIPVNVL